MSITTIALAIPDVLLLEPQLHSDDRGHFYEVWNRREFAVATGYDGGFAQDNQSRSKAGVVRGLHYQLPRPQGKIVRVATGAGFMVAVDIRKSSATFAESVTATLTADNRQQLWIPRGFAHGFMALSEPTDVLYKVTTGFAPECDHEIRWDDPALGIEWPLDRFEPLLSAWDRLAPLLENAEVYP